MAAQTTGFQIGYCEGGISDLNDLADVSVSRLGGPPVPLGLLNGVGQLPTVTSSKSSSFGYKFVVCAAQADQLRSPACRVCGSEMPLAAQVHAPLQRERVLYVWGCNRYACMNRPGSWHVVRGLAPAPQTKPHVDMANVSAAAGKLLTDTKATSSKLRFSLPVTSSLFDSAMFEDVESSNHDKICTQLSSLELHSTTSVMTSTTSDPLPLPNVSRTRATTHKNSFRPIYITFDDEWVVPKCSKPERTASSGKNPQIIAAEKLSDISEGEVYERTHVPGVTRELQTFMRQCSENPEQVLRYRRGGNPLHFNSLNCIVHAREKNEKPISNGEDQKKRTGTAQIPPKCAACGSPRVFEMQLMPAMLSSLATEHAARKSGLILPDNSHLPNELVCGGMEFGSVLVYTCSADCSTADSAGKPSYMDEVCIAELESDT